MPTTRKLCTMKDLHVLVRVWCLELRGSENSGPNWLTAAKWHKSVCFLVVFNLALSRSSLIFVGRSVFTLLVHGVDKEDNFDNIVSQNERHKYQSSQQHKASCIPPKVLAVLSVSLYMNIGRS